MTLRWHKQGGMEFRKRTVFLEATGRYLVPWLQPEAWGCLWPIEVSSEK